MQNGLIKLILKTFAITLGVVVGGFVFIVTSLSVLWPQSVIGLYSGLGLVESRAYMLERIYHQTGKNEDLYNVIEVKIQTKNDDDIIRYIKKMQSNMAYADFCEAVNERNTNLVTPSLYVYVCDYDAYLREQYVIALYNIGSKEKAQTIALEELAKNTNDYAWEFGAFVDCVVHNDKLTSAEKKTALSNLYDFTVSGQSVQSWINNQYDQLDESGVISGFEKLKILHQKIIIKTTNKILAQAKNETVLAEALVSDIIALNIEYNQTIALLTNG